MSPHPVASRKDASRRAMVRYLGECRARGLSRMTEQTYSWALRTVHRALADADLIQGPTTFDLPQAIQAQFLNDCSVSPIVCTTS